MDQFPISQGVQGFLERTGSRYVHRLANKVNDQRFPLTKVSPLNLGYLQFPQEIMKDTPVAFYRLNADANDSTANVLDGTASNVTFSQPSLLTYPSGGVPISSGSASFAAGSSSNVLLPTNALLNITGNVTLEAWVKSSQSTAVAIIGGYSGTTGYGITLNNVTSGKFQYTVRGNNYEITGASVNDNVRHQLAVTATSTTIRLYVDGLVRNIISANGQPTSYSGARRIGSVAAGGSYYTGNAEEVAIFNTALTDLDILTHWFAGTATQVLPAVIPVISVIPTTVARGAQIQITWSGVSVPTNQDWFGLFTSPSAADSAFLTGWVYENGTQSAPVSGASSGTTTLTVPAGATPGSTYEVRMFYKNVFTRLATSSAITVT